MKFALYRRKGVIALGAVRGDALFSVPGEATSPGVLQQLLEQGREALEQAHRRLLTGHEIDPSSIEFLPPFPTPEKILCAGLNYRDHASESGFEPPKHLVIFGRFASSLTGHKQPIVRPTVSEQLDYEGEMVAVIGKGGRGIAPENALDHIAGYSIFNDASIRDYQLRTPQWTIGKNFDSTGAFGPYFVTADDLPPGARGLMLRTRLNGEILQKASTSDLIFDVATQVASVSEAMTLRPGDLFVTGTPSGVGMARNPKIFMKPGDLCEVEIEGIGLLSNPVAQQEM